MSVLGHVAHAFRRVLGVDAPALERPRALRREGLGMRAAPFGVACWNGSESLTDVVARADAALYEAKRAGRDRLVAAG
jgi:GGDEF domain-containing protein